MSCSIPLMMHSMGHLERHKTVLIGDRAKQKILFAIFRDNLVTGSTEALDSFKKAFHRSNSGITFEKFKLLASLSSIFHAVRNGECLQGVSACSHQKQISAGWLLLTKVLHLSPAVMHGGVGTVHS